MKQSRLKFCRFLGKPEQISRGGVASQSEVGVVNPLFPPLEPQYVGEINHCLEQVLG